MKHIPSIVKRGSFLFYLVGVLFLFCSKKVDEKEIADYQKFTNYLARHVDSTDFNLNRSRTLWVIGKCTNWDSWGFDIDSINALVSKNGAIVFKAINSKSYSTITRTWTPSIPDTHSSMGNSLTAPESLFTFDCMNNLLIDSVDFHLKLLRKQ